MPSADHQHSDECDKVWDPYEGIVPGIVVIREEIPTNNTYQRKTLDPLKTT